MAWRANPFTYRRRPTREVRVGTVGVGGRNPIRVQSMTTTPTRDVAATVAQALRLVEAGCELVRVTVPTTRDADALPSIREQLAARGCAVPLIADVHFTPQVALHCVDHVDKVRINPGNYADRKAFAVREYTDDEYAAELDRIETVFGPLVDLCRERGVALRIGTNHGSLSDRILNRYGDTPLGMVESALEFVRICERRNFRDIVLSMKASGPGIVMQAYRLLVDRMDALGMDYPLHLGVTEAGDGEDARIKSAIGIGALLDEGLGDTVRVSLTEDPVAEIPVARALVAPYDARGEVEIGPVALDPAPVEGRDRYGFRRRPSRVARVGPACVGGDHAPAVEVPVASPPTDVQAARATIDALVGTRVAEDARPEIVSFDVATPADVEALAALRTSVETVAPRLALCARLATANPDGDLVVAATRAAHRVHAVVTDDGALEAVVPGLVRAARNAGCAVLFEGTDDGEDADRAARRVVEAIGQARAAGLDATRRSGRPPARERDCWRRVSTRPDSTRRSC
jgi:(E)-4-hydroxy-3-methylbut-2-enyl-diphosphate synthase